MEEILWFNINRVVVHTESHPPTKHNMQTQGSKMPSGSTPFFYLCYLLLVSCLLLLEEAKAARHGGISLRSQHMALLQWKATLASPPPQMSSWQEHTSPCNWTGIMCTAVRHGCRMPLVVTNISLPDAGSIPSSIGNITKLGLLQLNRNQITGSIPQEVGNLMNLKDLSLYENQISGAIPNTFGKLQSIQELQIFSNKLSGSLPQEFGELINLVVLELANNSLSGPLPANICLGGNLQFLSISYNMFNGPIPRSLKTCTTLVRLRLESNQLTEIYLSILVCIHISQRCG